MTSLTTSSSYRRSAPGPARRAQGRLREFNAHDMAETVWAFATAGVPALPLFDAVALAASGRLREAAAVIGAEPAALQLRYLQTLTEVAMENNSTLIFPIPMDLLTPFLQAGGRTLGGGSQDSGSKGDGPAGLEARGEAGA